MILSKIEGSYDLYSSGYLDVSVPQVPPLYLSASAWFRVLNITIKGIAPFGNRRFVMSVGGLIDDIALIHASFFGSNCQGIHHWRDFSHLSRLSIRQLAEIDARIDVLHLFEKRF